MQRRLLRLTIVISTVCLLITLLPGRMVWAASGPVSDYQANDEQAAAALQSWYNVAAGNWNSLNRWQWANAVSALENTYTRTNGMEYGYAMTDTYDQNASGNFLTDAGYDDEGWWALAWLRAYDVTGNTRYLSMAKTIFSDMATNGWDTTTCGGGMWWNKARTYKNAITNELFLTIAARLHERTAGDTGSGSYLDWAMKEWTWFSNSGLINSSNLVNDGLTNSCTNNGQTTWTYNQGVILGGLTDLYKITGNSSYLSKAEAIASATISTLVYASGILREPCEPSSCDGDQEQFKGIFMLNLAYLYDEDHKSSYATFLAANANAIWANDENSSHQLGLLWTGPFDTATPARQSSAMMAMSALAEPWTQGAAFARGTQDPAFGHAIGAPAGTQGWACSASTCTTANHMVYGPYISYLPLGTHTVHFRLGVNATSSSTANLVTLDVRETNNGNTLASRAIPWNAFTAANAAQDFTLTYTNTTPGDFVEFRVYWNNVPGAPTLTAADIVVDGGAFNWVATNLNHSIGRLDGLNAWEVDPIRDTHSDFLSWGPYTAELGSGNYTAYFELKVDNFNLDSSTVATIDVRDNDTGQVVAEQNILRNNFPDTLYQLFPLSFNAISGHHYEFRVYWYDSASAPRLTERGVYVQPTIHDTQVNLPYNLRGIGTYAGDANLDGEGDALKSTLGTSIFSNYHRYQIGPASSGALNVWRGGSGVSVSLPGGSYQELHILALAVNGNQTNQPFRVTYSDGSTATQYLSLSDWFASSPQANERFAVAQDTRWGPSSTQYGNIHLFDYTIVLDSSRTLQSLTLPNNTNVEVLAVTLSTSG